MSTMMQTQNPEAHARMTGTAPLPGVGDTVVYNMRLGEMRAGLRAVPAMVLKRDEASRRLTLLAMFDQRDMMTIPDVQESVGEDHGWAIRDNDVAALKVKIEELTELVARAALALDQFKAELAELLLGGNEKPEASFQDRMVTIEATMERLQPLLDQAAKPAAAPKGKAKRK